MSKIAIVTFLSDNYGTCLQAFALKKAVEQLGHSADVLNIERSSHTVKTSKISKVRTLFNDFPYVLPFEVLEINSNLKFSLV